MSGIKFCTECLNILHPEEEKTEHRLLFVCKSCNYKEYIQDIKSMEENKIYQRDFVQAFTESFIDPDFCLDPSMPREKIICPTCQFTECVYLIEKEPGDKYLRKIYVCGRVGKNGRPSCKNIFTPLKYIKLPTRNETYAYREFGTSNDVIVMLHGNLTSSYIFERTFLKLSENFRIIAPDFRGFGLSSYTGKLESIDDLARDLACFFAELKLTNCSVLGWDLGAAVALKFAADFTNQGDISKLILVNPIGVTGKTYMRDDENSLIPEWPEFSEDVAEDTRVIEFDKAIEEKNMKFFKKYFAEEIFSVKTPENNRLESYIENFTRQRNFKDIITCLAKYDISETGSNEIENVRTKTLILCGRNDEKTPLSEAVQIENLIDTHNETKQVTLKIFEDAGHALMEDNFEDFIENLREFCIEEEENQAMELENEEYSPY